MIEPVKDLAAELTPDFCSAIRAEHDAARPFMPFNKGHFIETWSNAQRHGLGTSWMLKENGVTLGAIGGIIAPELIDGAKVASLAFWFVRRSNTGSFDATRLFLQFEMWAAMQGAERIVVALCYDTMGGTQELFLKSRGYLPYETRHYKALKAHGN